MWLGLLLIWKEKDIEKLWAEGRSVCFFRRLGRFAFYCFHCLCRWGAFGYSSCHDGQFRRRRVGSACVCVAAFLAFPHAHALSVDAGKTACWAPVGFSQFSHYLGVAFSHRGSVADAQSLSGSHLLGSPQSLLTSPAVYVVAWPCP